MILPGLPLVHVVSTRVGTAPLPVELASAIFLALRPAPGAARCAALLGLGLLAVTSCGGGKSEPEHVGEGAPASGTMSRGADTVPFTAAELARATYVGIFETPITLADGRYEGEPSVPEGAARPRAGIVSELMAFGDLDADGDPEAAVLLWESSGGSGTFLHLAVVARHEGAIRNVATAAVGDRVQVRTMKIADGRVVLGVVEQGPEDAACCPTQLARRTWRLEGEALSVAESEVEGRLSLGLLAGTPWTLEAWQFGEPAPREPGISLAFEDGKVAGFSGCNRYVASVTETAPGFISMGPAGATRRACTDSLMALEGRYLGLLGKVNRYSFLSGRLALGWQDGDRFGSLLFAPGTPGT